MDSLHWKPVGFSPSGDLSAGEIFQGLLQAEMFFLKQD